MIEEIPSFKINPEFKDKASVHGPIIDQHAFSERIIEFIESNLNSNYKEIRLCFLLAPDGEIMEATLEEEGYLKSLERCFEYYLIEEEYEQCEVINKLIKKI